MLNTGFEIRGDKNNPYHLSLGGVILHQARVVLVKKKSGIVTLPRETILSQESIEECLVRGISEEVGFEVKVERFLGSLITHFNRLDNTTIEKTTLYFLLTKVSEDKRNPSIDEIEDEIMYENIGSAIDVLKSQKNDEYKILQRLN